MKLSQKLLMVFLITALGGIIISGVAISSVDNIFTTFKKLSDTTAKTIILDEIKTLTIQFEIAVLRYQIDTNTPEQIPNIEKRLRGLNVQLDEKISQLGEFDDKEFANNLQITKNRLFKTSMLLIKSYKDNTEHQDLKISLRGIENKMMTVIDKQIENQQKELKFQEKETRILFSNTVNTIVIISCIVTSVGIFLAIIASRNITKPLTLLRNSTSEIIKGKYKLIKTQGENEIRDLTNNFNIMQESLKKQNQQKEELASMITHELTTPIVPIVTSCENLDETNLDDFQRKQVSRIIESSTELQEMIKGILDAQKLNMDTMKFTNKEFFVTDFLENVREGFAGITQKKNIQLKITSNEKITIKSDSNRIFQVIGNLIKNSIDFVSNSTGEITIGCNTINNKITFYVKDNGIGIPDEDQKKIFNEKFYQIDTSLEREHGGTGLGLVICKGIVEKLGGQIWIESKPNQGTSVFFTILKS